MNKPCLFLLGMVTLVAACKKSGNNEMARDAAPANLHKVEAIANKYGFRYDSIFVSSTASNKSMTAEKFEMLLSGQSTFADDHGDFPKVAVMTKSPIMVSQPSPGAVNYLVTGELTEFASRLLPNKYIMYFMSIIDNGTRYNQCTNSEFYFVGLDVFTQWTYVHNLGGPTIGAIGASGTSTEMLQVSGVSLTRLYSVLGTYNMSTNVLKVTMSKKN